MRVQVKIMTKQTSSKYVAQFKFLGKVVKPKFGSGGI
jgi:hypothetical protein